METDSRYSKQLKDHMHHPHQLFVFNEEPWDESKQTPCSICPDLLAGESYSCAECEFHLHKKCAEAPYALNLPLHRQHSPLFLIPGPVHRMEPFPCNFCWGKYGTNDDILPYYICIQCCFGLDLKCALYLLGIGENFQEVELDFHGHPLLLLENGKDELKRISCNVCNQPLLGSIYVCSDCRLYLHKKCIDQLPLEINHPCHRRHHLSLMLLGETHFCEICKENNLGIFYECSACVPSGRFYIHLKCATLGSFNNVGDKTHQHTFNLFWRLGSFTCDACGTKGGYASYICSICHVQVHEQCTSLPRIIRITRHYDHPIFHNYFAPGDDLDQKRLCRICYNEVKKEHGCYSCLKKDCDYIVHVNCAIVEGDCWIIDEDEVEDLVVESSITRIIKWNDNGEAVEVEHFSHEHFLILGDHENKEDDHKYCCDGCMLSISGLFYYCPQCDFFLHKTCAELPRKKHHWFHQHNTKLESASSSDSMETIQGSFLPCQICSRVGSGLFYKCYEGYDADCLVVCLRCASLPDALVHPGHKHLVFCSGNYEGNCIACGDYIYTDMAFGCKDCGDYRLDFKCMTLPLEARHKYDKHLLRLVYRDENDDPEKHYCDICEEKRDPNHWFYMCSVCDNSIHPKCVLGEHPFIKIGSILTAKDGHSHPFTFVKKVYYYPECSACGKPCLDIALECAPSDCILHLECPS